MAYDVDTRPGAWVSKQAAKRGRRVLLLGAASFATGTVLLVVAVGHRLGMVTSLCAVGAVAAFKRYADRRVDAHSRWARGAQSERSVGERLNELRREGWILMHDVTALGGGNADHIAAGPNGVFVVETKHRRYDQHHLAKIKRQAARLHDELGIWVTPVICLATRSGKARRYAGVWIVPGDALLEWLRAQRNVPVEHDRLARFADRL